MGRTTIISCRNGHRLKVPVVEGTLSVTCPECKDAFDWSPSAGKPTAKQRLSISHLRPAIPDKVRETIDARAGTADTVAAESIRDVVGVDDHMEYSLKLIKKYRLRAAETGEIGFLLDEVQYRKNDPRLFLGVIGEFSSGKSTLINALLHDNLLRMDVLPATTSAATIMSYGESLEAVVILRDGQRKLFSKDKGTLRRRLAERLHLQSSRPEHRIIDFIHRYSAEERYARNVAALHILHPSSSLLHGLVIVDTPGTNVDNPRHAEVVAQALRFICDAAVVVIPADIPCSQSLLTFLRSNLQDSLHRCVFVVTKIDTIRREAERERLLNTIRAIITRETGSPHPVILAAAPLSVVDRLETQADGGSQPANERNPLVDQFGATERALYRFLEANRTLILVERLVDCLTVLLSALEQKLHGQEQYCHRYHDTLVRNQIPDLAGFIRQQQHHHTQEFIRRTAEVIRQLPGAVEQCQEGVLQALHRDISNADTTEVLKTVAEDATKKYMAWAQNQFQASLRSLTGGIASLAEQQHAQFKQQFLSIYKSLASLDGSVADAFGDISSADYVSVGENGQAQVLIQDLQNAIDKENVQSRGGAGAGAVIGTFILPGIGTVVGGILGWIIGALFGPSLDELKADAQRKLDASVRESFAQWETNARRILDQSASQAADSLNALIEAYFRVYRRKVAAMIAKDAEMKDKLARYRRSVQGDLQELKLRHVKLAAARDKLRSISAVPSDESQTVSAQAKE